MIRQRSEGGTGDKTWQSNGFFFSVKQEAKASAMKRRERYGRTDEMRGCKILFLPLVKLLKKFNKMSDRCPSKVGGHKCDASPLGTVLE